MKPNKNLFRTIKYFFRCKKATIYALIMCVLGLMVGLATPLCNKALQQDIIPNKNISLFVWLTIIILVLNLVSALTSYFTSRIFTHYGVPISSNIRKDIVRRNIFSKKNKDLKGTVLVTSTTFIEDMNAYYISYMYLLFDCILKLLFYFPFFVVYGGYLSLIMLASTIVSFVFIFIADIFCRKSMKKSRIADADRFEYTLDLLEEMKNPNFEENETFNMETYMQKVYTFDKTWLSYCNWANMYPYIFYLIWYVGVAICFCLVFNMLGTGAIIMSTFVLFNSYLDQLKAPIGSYLSYKLMAVRYDETFKNIFEMLDDEELKVNDINKK